MNEKDLLLSLSTKQFINFFFLVLILLLFGFLGIDLTNYAHIMILIVLSFHLMYYSVNIAITIIKLDKLAGDVK